ncbi:riboflavin kinase [Chloropicon primus]|uniref:riboflavin kinase n=2 Tax=Chloropicon primus TaxID=1764295 RepID=A0A5B8MYH2_9CHLO|nr:riboflavin kinase [Chloropicon primus]UPR03808.1 riboflavin kinase [Chloropicon primus]|eukprot:QDZ24600.1 riboflavin kinase [Chloropicon primus]
MALALAQLRVALGVGWLATSASELGSCMLRCLAGVTGVRAVSGFARMAAAGAGSDEVRAVEPHWLLKGTVIQGFGRGSKELGIPTANLDAKCLSEAGVDDNNSSGEGVVSGIYCGFACLPRATEERSKGVHPMVMSIGWNPFYKNKERTVEPWILHDYGTDFHGEELRLLVCCYIRPEQNFTSLEALVERIHEDARVTKVTLEREEYKDLAGHTFLRG